MGKTILFFGVLFVGIGSIIGLVNYTRAQELKELKTPIGIDLENVGTPKIIETDISLPQPQQGGAIADRLLTLEQGYIELIEYLKAVEQAERNSIEKPQLWLQGENVQPFIDETPEQGITIQDVTILVDDKMLEFAADLKNKPYQIINSKTGEVFDVDVVQ